MGKAFSQTAEHDLVVCITSVKVPHLIARSELSSAQGWVPPLFLTSPSTMQSPEVNVIDPSWYTNGVTPMFGASISIK